MRFTTYKGESANISRDRPGPIAEFGCERRWRGGVSVTRTITGTILTCDYHNRREISGGGTTDDNKRYSVGHNS